MTEIIRAKDKQEYDKIATELIAKNIANVLKSKEFVVLAVPGGRSVAGIFKEFITADIPWQKVHIFIVDERLVPLEDQKSNYKLAFDSFLGELVAKNKLPKENIHPFVYDSQSIDKGTNAYETELKKFGGVYDIVLLSSGEDGHVGGLYPSHHSFSDESEFFVYMDDSPKPPKDRMSMSRKLLLKSEYAILVYLGAGKKDALDMFLDENVSVKDCPAKIVQEIENSWIVTDITDLND